QNDIIKIFSVAAVVFLPPTLLASIYGMNFHHMPELDWFFGYPFALVLMVLAAVFPYIFFKSKRLVLFSLAFAREPSAHFPRARRAAAVKTSKENIHAISRSWSRSSFSDSGSCAIARAGISSTWHSRPAVARVGRPTRLLLLKKSLASRPLLGQWHLCARAV